MTLTHTRNNDPRISTDNPAHKDSPFTRRREEEGERDQIFPTAERALVEHS
jgi:hypothetical protein